MKAPNGGYSDNGRKPVSFVCFTEKRNSMKAGIVTFHGANNYGAVLQAYALTQWLGQNGVDAEIINYQSGVFDKYRLFRTWKYKKEPYMLGVDFVKYSEKKKRNQNFDAFRRRFLPISEKVYRKESDFEGIADQYDYFICGSDQIWNPVLTKGIDPVYFLNFVRDPGKKIAYAPSIALKRLNEFQLAEMAGYLSEFASLSVREQEGIELLQPYCEKDIAMCCDPVFLPEKECYDAVCSEKHAGEKFVFLYVVGRAAIFKNVISYAEKTAKEKGLKLYYLIDGDKALYHIDGKNVFGCDPCDFLSLIKNAEYVVSNSFHATAFAILYSRQFITFLKEGTGSRMVNLLRSFHLEDRIYHDSSDDTLLENRIDCSGAKQMLEDFRKSSSDYLLTALGLKKALPQKRDEKICALRRENYAELLRFIEWRRQVYLVRHRNPEVVAQSRSGGVFTALSDAVLSLGGAVYGCMMESPETAVHHRASTKEERDLFRGSKYIQSEMRGCFRQVRTDLENGIPVLFSGTGCQVAGLYQFLEGTDISGLTTMDIVCHGTSSPKLWREYIHWMKRKYGNEISEVKFRDKRYGWKAHLETVRTGDTLHTTANYRVLYLKGAFLRPSCYECPFSRLKRRSDITIGDAWGIETMNTPLNDDKGCSLVLVNSERGRGLFERCRPDITAESVDLKNYLQHNLYEPSAKPADRRKYWEYLNQRGFDALTKRYGKADPYRRIKERRMIRKAGKL